MDMSKLEELGYSVNHGEGAISIQGFGIGISFHEGDAPAHLAALIKGHPERKKQHEDLAYRERVRKTFDSPA